MEQAQGNAFAQFIHDGGTLKNHKKYQALAMQFIAPDWDTNWVICFGFPRSTDNKDLQVAELAKAEFQKLTCMEFESIFDSTIADRAAKGVSGYLEHEEEVCDMHDGEKLGRSATGILVRTKDKTVINPFPEGEKLMMNAKKIASDFTYSGRTEALWNFGKEKLGEGNFPKIGINLAVNETRIASQHGLLQAEIRLNQVLRPWHDEKNTVVKPLQWDSTDKLWQEMAEFESVLNITKITTTLSQYEHLFTGAFSGLIKSTTMAGLRNDKLDVIDLKKVGDLPVSKLPRVEMNWEDLSPSGKKCLERATLEGERRWCGNEGESLTSGDVILSDREVLAGLLDLRTIRHFGSNEKLKARALKLLEAEYTKYVKTARDYEIQKKEALEAAANAQASAALAEAAAKAGAAGSSSASSTAKDVKPKITSGASYTAHNPWADDPAVEDDPPFVQIDAAEGTKIDFKRAWTKWSRLDIHQVEGLVHRAEAERTRRRA